MMVVCLMDFDGYVVKGREYLFSGYYLSGKSYYPMYVSDDGVRRYFGKEYFNPPTFEDWRDWKIEQLCLD